VVSGIDATTRYGTDYTGGVIKIRTKAARSDQASRFRHPRKLGLLRSSNGTGMLTSVPYRPPLKYVPVGNTVSDARPYWRASRRRSPIRCPVPNSQNARSRNIRFVRAAVSGVAPGSVSAASPATPPFWRRVFNVVSQAG